MSATELLREIEREHKSIRESDSVGAFLGDEEAKLGDFLVINNSFFFREIPTTKNQRVLSCPITSTTPASFGEVLIGSHRMNNDYKLVPAKDPHLKPISLKNAVESELKHFGTIAYILLGEIDQRVIHTEPIGHSLFANLLLHTGMTESVSFDKDTITINDLSDEDAIWAKILSEGRKAGLIPDPIPDGFEKAIAVSLEKLNENARMSLSLPGASSLPKKGILNHISESNRTNILEYDEALKKCGGKKSQNPGAYNEVLRISYNYATEAIQLLELLTEICDLKPICLWLTLASQWNLSREFRQLPWTRPGKKSSLKDFKRTVGGARNSAFHHFLPFSRTVDVKVDGLSLSAKKLTLFCDHGKRQNSFEFDDQPIIEALLAFTRSEEKAAAPSFWKQTSRVMSATADFIDAFDKALRLIHGASGA